MFWLKTTATFSVGGAGWSCGKANGAATAKTAESNREWKRIFILTSFGFCGSLLRTKLAHQISTSFSSGFLPGAHGPRVPGILVAPVRLSLRQYFNSGDGGVAVNRDKVQNQLALRIRFQTGESADHDV